MGKDVVNVANHIRVLMASNEDWVVPAGLDDRRFCIIDVGESRAQDEKYFGEIRRAMGPIGRAALLNYLMHYDLRGLSLRKIPDTQARLDQQKFSMDPLKEYWFGQLCNPSGWREKVETAEVMREYKDHAGRFPLNPTHFGISTRALFPTLRKRQLSKGDGSKMQVQFYLLAAIKEARAEFEKAVGRTFNWAKEESEPGEEGETGGKI